MLTLTDFCGPTDNVLDRFEHEEPATQAERQFALWQQQVATVTLLTVEAANVFRRTHFNTIMRMQAYTLTQGLSLFKYIQ